LGRNSCEDRICKQLARAQLFGIAMLGENSDLCHRLECDGARWTGNHALAALHAGRSTHGNVQIKADPSCRSFAGASNDVILANVIASAHTAIAEYTCAVIDHKNRGGGIELPSAGEWPRRRRRIGQKLAPKS